MGRLSSLNPKTIRPLRGKKSEYLSRKESRKAPKGDVYPVTLAIIPSIMSQMPESMKKAVPKLRLPVAMEKPETKEKKKPATVTAFGEIPVELTASARGFRSS